MSVFDNLYVGSKSLEQPKYKYLTKTISKLQKHNIGYFIFTNSSKFIPLKDALDNSIFNFDDIVNENQDVIREYFSRVRHSIIDTFYSCQTYSKIPKQLIRNNANLLMFFVAR